MARHKSKKGWARGERYSDSRYAWVMMPKFETIVYINDDLDDGEPDDQTNADNLPYLGISPIRLMFRFPNRRITLNLTAWTESELDEFKKIVNHAIECARPGVQALDELAAKEFQEGGDDNPRLFRPDPMPVYRDRFRPDYTHLMEMGYDVTNPDPPDSPEENNGPDSGEEP